MGASSPPATTPAASTTKPPSPLSAAPALSKPLPGKVTRHRLNRGATVKATTALWTIAFCRLHTDPTTRAYADRRTKEGKSDREIMRCL